VAVKLLLPSKMAGFNAMLSEAMTQNIDVKAVFSAVGDAFTGKTGAAGAAETAFLRGFTHFFGTNLVAPALLVSRGLSFYLPLLLTGCITLLFRFSPFPFPLFSKQKVLT